MARRSTVYPGNPASSHESSDHTDCEFALAEMADALECLLGFSRVATFDEADGEGDAVEHAWAILQRHKPAT